MNRKSRSRFALLPLPTRNALNQKLADGWQYEAIRHWLFDQKADRDIPALELKAGDPYSLVWTRTTPDEKIITRNFGVALSAWYHTHFPLWQAAQADRDADLDLIERIDDLTANATSENRAATHLGGNLLIRSLILEAIRTRRDHPDQLARLAHAWAKLSKTDEHTAHIGLQALHEEIKANPEALAFARQMITAAQKKGSPSTS